jgi:hypothetical protein
VPSLWTYCPIPSPPFIWGRGRSVVVVVVALIGWGLAGLTATRVGGSRRRGIVAALWSDMVSALVGAAGEVARRLRALPRLAQHELSNPAYTLVRMLRSAV